VRALVQPPILNPHLATKELRLAAFDLERIDILANQEEAAFAGVDV
jgi:hypothetical protein